MQRVALVTGSGQSVGRGIAEVLGGAGFAVAVNDLHPERAEVTAQAIADAGGRAMAIPFDVTDPEAVESGLAKCASDLGPVDVLVNNAGVVEGFAGSQDRTSFLESDPARWMRQYELNLFGSMHCIHALTPGMVKRGWGRVIQISSGAAAVGMNNGMSLYASAKAGIEGLLRHLSMEIALSGVTANAISLGMMENNGQTGAPVEVIEKLRSRVPIGRFGTAMEAGAAVRWLASEEGGWVTGQVIHLNGGSVFGR
jgi:NAD(P)-dependent dehydrogenase (short-subunit alcohol dehydrogenase family)